MSKKVIAALLCFFLGGLGIHNFYLGQTKSGIGKIVLFLLCFVPLLGLVPLAILAIWVIYDLIKIIIAKW